MDEIVTRVRVDAGEAMSTLRGLSVEEARSVQAQITASDAAASAAVRASRAETEAIRSSLPVEEQSALIKAKRGEASARLTQRLAELLAAKNRDNVAIKNGATLGDDDVALGVRREKQITRISDALARRRLAEQAAGDAVSDAMKRIQGTGKDAGEALGKVASEAVSVGLGALGLAGGLSGVITVITQLANVAVEARRALADLAREERAGSANTGGKNMGEMQRGIDQISVEMGFDDQGRKQLGQAFSAATDAQPDMSQEDQIKTVRNLALLQRATGVGGEDGQKVMFAMQKQMKVSQEKAVDMASTLLNSGFEASNLNDVLNTGADQDMLALNLAIRREGVTKDMKRVIPSIMDRMNSKLPNGHLDPVLARVGITPEMPISQRIELLIKARDEGDINQGVFENTVGGTRNAFVVNAMKSAIQDGGFAKAQEELRAGSAQGEVDKILQNPDIAVQEDVNRKSLRGKIAEEQAGRVASTAWNQLHPKDEKPFSVEPDLVDRSWDKVFGFDSSAPGQPSNTPATQPQAAPVAVPVPAAQPQAAPVAASTTTINISHVNVYSDKNPLTGLTGRRDQ